MKTAALLFGFGFVIGIAGCSAEGGESGPSTSSNTPTTGAAGRTSTVAAASGGRAGSAAGTTATQAGAGSSVSTAADGGVTQPTGPVKLPADDGCGDGKTFKREGCPCRAGETAACWTGNAADRNVGTCHDGLQICTGTSEFGEWGPCNGEEQVCGTDAGTPPPPPPPTKDCPCIPGAVIQCSEDCSVGIICSLTATKTCQPDRTWTTCHEDPNAVVDLPGLQCRNMLHGCLTEDDQGELYVGDCSKQFECGRAPGPN